MDPGWDVSGRSGSRSCFAKFFTRTAVRVLNRLAKRSGLATAWCRRFAVSHASCLSGGLRRLTRLVVSRPPSLPPAGDILGVTFWWGDVYYPWSDVPPPPLPPALPFGLGRRRALRTFVQGARRGPPPLPPRRVPCRALRGCRSCVLSRRGSRSCAPGLRPRRPLLTYVVGVAVPAALVQLRPRRLCYIGTWAPKALCLVVVWVTSGEERLRSLELVLPSRGVPCARTEASVGT